MIAAAGQFRDLDVALLILFLMIATFIPDWVRGVRDYRAGRDLAHRITAEHQARKALEKRAR
jgi:hypothetical protein